MEIRVLSISRLQDDPRPRRSQDLPAFLIESRIHYYGPSFELLQHVLVDIRALAQESQSERIEQFQKIVMP